MKLQGMFGNIKKKIQKSLKKKTLVIIIFILTIAIGLTLVVNILHFRYSMQAALEREIFASGLLVRKTVNTYLNYFSLDRFSGMSEFLQGILKSNKTLSYCFITDHNQKILYHNDDDKTERNLSKAIYLPEYFQGDKQVVGIGKFYELILPILNVNEDNKRVGHIHLGVKKSVIDSQVFVMIMITIVIFIIALMLSVFLLLYFISKTVVNPISRLSDEMAVITSSMIFDKEVEVNSEDEIGELGKTFNFMMNEIRNYSENLEELVAEKTKQLRKAMDALWGEMELAKKIQTALLPKNLVLDDFEISATMQPADEVGGDYYDVISVKEKGIDWFIIGDVSGHGVPAGLIMMMTQTSIHSVLDNNPDLPPDKLLTKVNKTVTSNIRLLNENKYMTISVLAREKNGRFHFSGLHQDIIVYRADRNDVEMIETEGMWIGIMDDISEVLKVDSFELNIGDVMLLFTDGIVESRDKSGAMLEVEGLVELFRPLCKRPTEEIKDEILKTMKNYQTDDDLTLLVVRRTG